MPSSRSQEPLTEDDSFAFLALGATDAPPRFELPKDPYNSPRRPLMNGRRERRRRASRRSSLPSMTKLGEPDMDSLSPSERTSNSTENSPARSNSLVSVESQRRRNSRSKTKKFRQSSLENKLGQFHLQFWNGKRNSLFVGIAIVPVVVVVWWIIRHVRRRIEADY